MSRERFTPPSDEVFYEVAERFGTPTYIYDEAGIKSNARKLLKAFDWSPGFVNHFAVKATPVPAALRAVQAEGMGFDCSSLTELLMIRDQVSAGDSPIFYTSNNTPDYDYQVAAEMGAIINIDKLAYLEQLVRALGSLPTSMAIRYNPGKMKKGNDIIGDPKYAKFGDTEEHVLEALGKMKANGVENIGLHTMVVSNDKDPDSFAETARLLRELAEKAQKRLGVELSFINIGGGTGVKYRPKEKVVNIMAIGEAVKSQLGDTGIPVVAENGRYVTGPHGYFLAGVTHGITETHTRQLQVDTSVNNMARLATVTAAYHRLRVLGREKDRRKKMTVVGSLCANTDRFFKDRMLPETTQPGDLLVIYDAGAHMQANSHNYNGQTRAGGVILRENGQIEWAIHPETEQQILARTAGL